jgi:thiamine pyrophosphate-dependent acetolactate synthase large subunit-like protein
VKSLGLPCTNTLMGLGAYPGSDPQFLGMLGMHGTYEANMAMQYCDVLIAVGARFDDRVISVPSHFLSQPKKIIHIDVDPSSISKRVKVDVPIVGDVKHVLREMLDILRQSGQKPDAGIWLAGGSRSKNGVAQQLAVHPVHRADQAAIRGGKAVRDHRWQGHHRFRCGTASDVGGAVLQV